MCTNISDLHVGLAKKATDKPLQRKEWLLGIKFAIVANECERAENGKSDWYAKKLERLVSDFKKSLAIEEQGDVDAEVTRLTAEVKAQDK